VVLKPVKMAKIMVISTSDNKKKIIDHIHELGIFHIESIDQEKVEELVQDSPPEEFRKLTDLLVRFRGLQKFLIPQQINEKFLFKDQDDLFNKIKEINIDDEIATIRAKLDSIKLRRKQIEDNLETLQMLKNIGIDLKNLNASHLFYYLGRIDKEFEEKLLKDLSNFKNIVLAYKSAAYFEFFVSGPRDIENNVLETLNKYKVKIFLIPNMDQTTDDAINMLKNEESILNLKERELMERLNDLSKKYYGIVSAITEELEIETKKYEAYSFLGRTREIFGLTAWIPERDLERVESDLRKIAENKIIFRRIETDEEPPTLLENPKKLKFFEFFVKFYSLPKSLEFDPTLIFGIVFPIFFGLMLGDVGYAIVILIFALYLKRRIEKPPKKSLMPRSILNFARSLMSKYSWLQLSRALIFGSIYGIIFGFLFNVFFGFPFLPFTIFDPVTSVSKLLFITALIGVIYVSYGLILGALNHYNFYKYFKGEEKERHYREMFGRIGWLFVAWGFTIIGLLFLKHMSIAALSLYPILGWAFLFAGIALLLYGEGYYSVMEIASIVSHILSFTRILGVLLASIILAYVLDEIFLKSLHYGVLLHITIAFIVLLFGHITNITIGIFEPGIQGARLHYVEFFSKFFNGNGRPFSPFASNRKFTYKEIK